MDDPASEQPTLKVGSDRADDARLGHVLEDALKSATGSTDLAALPDIGNRNRFIDDYEILNEPPRMGGMGVVYKARHLRLGRVVAMKMLHGEAAKDETAKKRFLKEAKTIAALHDENIISILGYGELEGCPFFTMEYIERNLASQVRERSLEPKEAARCVRVLARAVQVAHDHDVLHRDLKPSNILVDRDGKLLVADFGLAKAITPGKEESITLKEQGVGTPGYMAPEQISGKACRESDVYGLGAILYFLLVGRPPFLGATGMETLMLVQSTDPVSLSQLNRRVGPDLEAVCLKCLEKDPAARYRSARELAEDLQRYLNDEPTRARPLGPVGRLYRLGKRHPREATLLAILTGVLLAATMVSTLFYLKADESRAQYFGQYQQAQILRANEAAASERLPDALALLAEVLNLNPTNQLAAERLLFLLTHRQVSLPVGAPMPSGEQIVQARFNADGGQLLALGTNEFGQRPLWLWDPSVAKLIRSGQVLGSNWIGRAAISSDLRRVALTETKDNEESIHVYDTTTGNRIDALGPLPPGLRLLSFTEADHSLRLFWRNGTVQTWSQGAQPDHFSAQPQASLADWGEAAAIGAVFSDDGRFLATSVSPNAIGVWDARTGRREGLIVHGHDSVPRVAFGAKDMRLISYDPGLEGKRSVLRVWDWRAQRLVAGLEQAELIQGPSLNPDGTLLALIGEKQRTVRLWTVKAQNAMEPIGEPIGSSGYLPVELVFNPSGRSLLTITARNNSLLTDGKLAEGNGPLLLWDLRRRNGPSGGLEQLSDVKHAAMSDDRRFLAVTQDPATNSESWGTNYQVQIWDLTTSRRVEPILPHAGPVEELAFSSDANLLLTGAQDTQARLWRIGTNTVLREFVGHSNWVSHVEFNRDTTRVLTGDRDGVLRLWTLGTSNSVQGLHERDEKVRLAAFSSNGRWAVTAAEDDLARLWDLQTMRCVRTQAAPATLSQILFSPDSSCVAMAAGDNQGTVQVWPTAGSRTERRAIQMGQVVNHLAFSPDSRSLLAASGGGFAALYDARTLELQGARLMHEPDVQQAVFSPNGERVATLSKDGTVLVWNLAWRSPISDRLHTGLQLALGIAFDASGQRLITYGLGGVRMLAVPRAPDRSPRWLPELAEIVAGQSFHGAGPAQPVSIEKLEPLRASLLATPASDPVTRWAHDFLARPHHGSNGWGSSKTSIDP